jgi:hypothetical protein
VVFSVRNLVFLFAICCSTTAFAKSKKVKSYPQLLKRDGWKLTGRKLVPEPGDIYNEKGELWRKREGCFKKAKSREKSMASSRAYKRSSVRASGLFGAFRAGGSLSSTTLSVYKDPKSFSIPIDILKKNMTEECLASLRNEPYKQDLVVVTSVIKAKYKKSRTKKRRGFLGWLGIGISAKSKSKRKEHSKKPTTIAYRRSPVMSFFPRDPQTQGTLLIKGYSTRPKGDKQRSRCKTQIFIDGQHRGYASRKGNFLVHVRGGRSHKINGYCTEKTGKKKGQKREFWSDVQVKSVPVSSDPMRVVLNMQWWTKEEVAGSKLKYQQSKAWDVAGYVVASGLSVASGWHYYKSKSLYKDAENITDVGQAQEYADLRAEGKQANEIALLTGGGGALVLTSALTHAIFTGLKKKEWNRRKRSRGNLKKK